MCRAIAEARAVDEVKDIRDKALALEVYARQARNTEAETKACEIRLRAERRVGQLLQEREKAKGAQGTGSNQHEVRYQPGSAPPLADLGISHNQSSRWQKLASIPDRDFEATFTTGAKPSTAGIIAAHTPKAPIPAVDPRAACEIRLRAERRPAAPRAGEGEGCAGQSRWQRGQSCAVARCYRTTACRSGHQVPVEVDLIEHV